MTEIEKDAQHRQHPEVRLAPSGFVVIDGSTWLVSAIVMGAILVGWA